MRKYLIGIFSLVMVLVCLFAMPTEANAAETVASGTCGENLTWTLDDRGTLTISGTGAMTNYAGYNGMPWYDLQSSILKVEIEDGVTTVGNYAFRSCKNLMLVTMGDSVVKMGDYAFAYCTSLTQVTMSNNLANTGYTAFTGCTSLTSITIPKSVTKIDAWTFEDCTGLTSIVIPDNVTDIGGGAFDGCTGLTSVTIGKGVVSSSAFNGCTALQEVHISDIAAWCGIEFSYNNGNPMMYADKLYLNGELVTELIIPDGVEEIKDYTFRSYRYLTSVTIPDSVTVIGGSAFYGCTNLESVMLGNGVETISGSAFSNCPKLSTITIPDSVTVIGASAFKECTGLMRVDISDIAAWCNIQFDDAEANPLYYAKNLYLNGEVVKELVVPTGVAKIYDYAFYNGVTLTSVELPDSVVSIGNYGFYNCSALTSVTIPRDLVGILQHAFDGCNALEAVYYGGTSRQWDDLLIASNNDALMKAAIQYNVGAVHQVHYGQKQLALGSKLCMDFYVRVNEVVAVDEIAKMQISLGGKLIDEIALKDIKQVEVDDEWYCWYVFTAEIPAKDMTKAITLQLVDSTGNVGDPYTYTVKQYADYLLANSTDEKVLNVCQALLDYGAAAEKHFTVRAGGTVADSELANGGDFGTRLDGVVIPDTYRPTMVDNVESIASYATSLIMEADTTIRLYFVLADGVPWTEDMVSINIVDATYNMGWASDKIAYIDITDIHAADLNANYIVTLTYGGEEITINYSGIGYAWIVLNSSDNANMRQLAKALYKYWEAAESYKQVPPPEVGENEFEILPF